MSIVRCGALVLTTVLVAITAWAGFDRAATAIAEKGSF